MADPSELERSYLEGVQGSGDKLVRRYKARTDKAARAASDGAQASYEAAMKDPKVLKRRQAKLRKVSDADMNAAMEATGAATYEARAAAAARKQAERAAPFVSEAERIASGFGPKSRDVTANVNARVLPIAKRLREMKEAQS